VSQIFRSIKWDPNLAIRLQSWRFLSESRSLHTVEKWTYVRILIQVGYVKLLPIEQNITALIVYFKIYSVNSLCAMIVCSIGNNFTQPTWINILRYIYFSTVCSERDLTLGQLWRLIAELGSHLIDLKIRDMVLSQESNNGNYLTFWNMKVVFFMHPNVSPMLES
jgi:hypothetical protein